MRPYKEAIFGLLTIIGGSLAAIFGAYKKQARRPEEALSEAADMRRVTHVTVTRLHHDDRQLVGDLQDAASDMTRAVKKLTKILVDEAESRTQNPRPGHEPTA